MTLRVFHYPNCSTCKKALKWLAANDLAFTPIDIVQTPPSVAELKRVLKLGHPLSALFNTSGQSYRAGNFKQRLTTMSEAEALTALASDGKLIKRPLVLADDFALVGFKEPEYERRFRR